MTKASPQNAVQRGGFDPHTVFADILAGKLPASFIYRDDDVAAFMDMQPINPGHVLVIPTQAAASLAELDPDVGAQMFRVGQRVAAAIRASDLKCAAVNLFLADGADGGQTVFHVHLHVFPRYRGDGFGWSLPARYYSSPARAELERIAEQLKCKLKP